MGLPIRVPVRRLGGVLGPGEGHQQRLGVRVRPGGFAVQYDKKAGKLWYLMPFEANIKTDSVEYNVVFQWLE